MILLAANVRNSNIILDDDDKNKIRTRFSKVPEPSKKLAKLYGDLIPDTFTAFENGICFFLDNGWNVVIDNEDEDTMNNMWMELVALVNNGRNEQLIPNEGHNITDVALKSLEFNQLKKNNPFKFISKKQAILGIGGIIFSAIVTKIIDKSLDDAITQFFINL